MKYKIIVEADTQEEIKDLIKFMDKKNKKQKKLPF